MRGARLPRILIFTLIVTDLLIFYRQNELVHRIEKKNTEYGRNHTVTQEISGAYGSEKRGTALYFSSKTERVGLCSFWVEQVAAMEKTEAAT